MGFQKGNKHAFPKGKPGNPNGRPKGSPNRTTKEMKELIKKVIDGKLEEFESDLDKMSPVHKWNIIEKMAKYFLPTLSKSEIDGSIDVEGGLTIKVVYEDSGDDNSISFDKDDLNED